MNIELSTGLPEAWQWDTNLKLKIPDEIPEAHFRFDGKAGAVDVEDGWVEVPNELLQKTDDIEVWTYDSEHTMDFGRITVRGRPKPDTYVYTPTEIKRWKDLDERIKALEENKDSAAVLYTEQELTEEQKAQARENIGAANEEDLTQADWNQNDPEGKGYIQNRPFYTEEAEDIVTDLGNTYKDWSEIINSSDKLYDTAISIKCNGTIYQDITPTSGYEGGTNYRYYHLDGGKFLITVAFASGSGYVSCSPEAEFQFISITHKDEVVHTLDSKYIKDMYYTEIVTNDISGTVIEKVPRSGEHTLNLPFELGQSWDADFGTTRYRNLPVCQSADGTFYIGDSTVSSYPFYIPANGTSISNSRWVSNMHPDSLATLTCISGSVENEKIHKIPDKYYDKPSAFIINVLSYDENDDGERATFTIDRTYDEILAAYNEGKSIGLSDNGICMALNTYDNAFIFTRIMDPSLISIISYNIFSDYCEVWYNINVTFGNVSNSATGKVPRVADELGGSPTQWDWVDYGGMLAINITYDSTNETYSADKTYDEIVSARDSGLIPVCKMEQGVVSNYTYGYCYYTGEIKPPINTNTLIFRNIEVGRNNVSKYVTVGISNKNSVYVDLADLEMTYSKDTGVTMGYPPIGANSHHDPSYFLRGDATWQPALQPPSTASVGQYLSVKSVDDNGVVSEVEAVDAPSESDISLGLTGVSAGQVLVVKTVDDNGKPLTWEAKNISDLVQNGNEVSY